MRAQVQVFFPSPQTATGEQNRVWIRSDCVLIMFNFRWPVLEPCAVCLLRLCNTSFLDISLKFCAPIDVLHISLDILYRCMGYYKLYFNFSPTDTFSFYFFRGSVTNFLKTPFGFHSITTNTFRTISKSINNKCVCRLFAHRIKFNGLFCIYDISHL